MTVDLDMMLDLRDLQVALDVQRRAEMGWFDVEFTMYGCAYYQNGERYYRVSTHDEKIYNFIENEQNLASDMVSAQPQISGADGDAGVYRGGY